jgi:hypothetical protein
MSIRPDDPRLADYTPEEIARGLPEIIAAQNQEPTKPPNQEPTKTPTPAEILAKENAARLGEVATAADRAGSFVSGEQQDRVDEILAGVRSGIYSVADALGALSNIETAGRAALGDGDDDNGGTEINQNAFAKIKGYLSEFGLSDLEGMVSELMARGIEEESAVLYELRNTTSFQKRFAANEARRAAGLPALTPRSYIDLENTYREVLRRGGMLEYFNRQDVFESLIGGDVSPAELYDRMTNAYQVVRDADAGTKAQMRQLYNIEEKDLAAYFLDPKTSVSMLKRRAEAAKIASIGKEQGGMQLTAQTAEDIAARGYTTAQAGTAFTTLTQQAGLYEALPGEEGLTEQERLGAAFGYDPMAALRLEQRKAGRKAVFQGGGQFASTRGATSGVVETGAGGPQ